MKQLFLTLLYCYCAATLLPAQIQAGSDILGEETGDDSGFSIALSGDGSRIVIGAPYHDGEWALSGQARVLEYRSGSWEQLGSALKEPFGFADQQGFAVDISDDGNRVVTGLPGYFEINPSRRGAGRVYTWEDEDWQQMGSMLEGGPEGQALISFGHTVAMSGDGNRIAVGTQAASEDAFGEVKVYEWDGAEWTLLGQPVVAENPDRAFASVVSLNSDGTILAVGNYNSVDSTSGGSVHVYSFNGNDWVQKGQTLRGNHFEDYFGLDLELNAAGDMLVVGSPRDSSYLILAGKVQVYSFQESQWVLRGEPLYGAFVDALGWTVAISADGDRIVCGAPHSDTWDIFVGYLQVYQWNGQTYVPIGLRLEGDLGTDEFASAVSISADGSRVAGASFENTFQSEQPGFTRVFDIGYLTGTQSIAPPIAPLILFPNPTNDGIINVEGHFEGACSIYSTTGQLISQQTVNDQQINLTALPAGTYWLYFGIQGAYKIIKKN